MKRLAVVFTSAPHGSSAGREGLDALLAASALCEAPGVFFIGDGVFQILSGQQPQAILSRDYIATFRILPLYDINDIMICAASLRERGLAAKPGSFVIDALPMEPQVLRERLAEYDVLLTF
ncbi:sulfurtransferase complex subunit TusC [Entomohabitans teleogrylli]|uniref:sulfurtransferase complex subunit TusC n=1 Tax=Entomohabitans teleogrylli TaxID=1384589 RepID=UPI00073D3D75|nr:sulfurtransferase complex subunit TusC [Entomohabitans teleogrylli]